MGILAARMEKRHERLIVTKSATPLKELKARLAEASAARDFAGALKRDAGIRLIAEMKKASPSKGPIRMDFEPDEIARIYDAHADAISVITEEDFFLGSLDYLVEAREASALPVMRKDFIFDEYQIYEARAAGADAILLIEGILQQSQAAELMQMAGEMGMGVLFEVHDERGLEKALAVDAPIIGINNRDLGSFRVDLGTTLRLKAEIPGGKTVVSESGIDSRADVRRLEEAGVDAVLVGTAFMESSDIAARIHELTGK